MATSQSDINNRINAQIHNAKEKLLGGGEAGLLRCTKNACDKLTLEADLEGLKRPYQPFLYYYGVLSYLCPDDIIYKKAIEIKATSGRQYRITKTVAPELKRTFFDDYNGRNNTNYGYSRWNVPGGTNLSDGVYCIETSNGNRELLLLFREQPNWATVCNLNSTDDNGTIAGSGSATNLRQYGQGYIEGQSSLAFDTNASGTVAIITQPVMDNVLDIASYVIDGMSFFRYVNTSADVPTGFELRIGSSSSDYYSMTATTQYNGQPIINTYNTIGFSYANKTTTGTPDDDNISYWQIRITFGTNAVRKGLRIDWLTVNLGFELLMDYYSNLVYVDTNGVRKQYATVSSDETVLLNSEDQLLIDQSAILALQELREFEEAGIRQKQLDKYLGKYVGENPSENEPQVSTYYNFV